MNQILEQQKFRIMKTLRTILTSLIIIAATQVKSEELQLVYFQIQENNNHLSVEWVNANAQEGQYIIERTEDGKTFNVIAEVSKNGSIQINGELGNQLAYYRLSFIDANGNKISSTLNPFQKEDQLNTHNWLIN